MSKQDGVYTRTAAALEQKHSFGKRFSEMLGIIGDTRKKVASVESSVATIIKNTDNDRAAIKLLVEYDSEGNPKASGSFIIQAINGESSAKIEADRLDIDGKKLNIKVDAANITGAFTVKEASGDTLFSAGNGAVKIGSWNVDKNSLWTGTSFSASNSVFLSTGSAAKLSIAGSPTQNNWVIKAGPNFGVNKNGEVYCSKAYIQRGCILGEDITTGEGMQIGSIFEEEWATIKSSLRLFEIPGGLNKGIEFVTQERGPENSFGGEHSLILSNHGAILRFYSTASTDFSEVSVGNCFARMEANGTYLEVTENGIFCGNGSTETCLWRNN